LPVPLCEKQRKRVTSCISCRPLLLRCLTDTILENGSVQASALILMYLRQLWIKVFYGAELILVIPFTPF